MFLSLENLTCFFSRFSFSFFFFKVKGIPRGSDRRYVRRCGAPGVGEAGCQARCQTLTVKLSSMINGICLHASFTGSSSRQMFTSFAILSLSLSLSVRYTCSRRSGFYELNLPRFQGACSLAAVGAVAALFHRLMNPVNVPRGWRGGSRIRGRWGGILSGTIPYGGGIGYVDRHEKTRTDGNVTRRLPFATCARSRRLSLSLLLPPCVVVALHRILVSSLIAAGLRPSLDGGFPEKVLFAEI